LTESFLRARDRLLETLQLLRDFLVPDDLMRDIGHLPEQQVRGTDGDPR
jgi:hypothetical protein